VPDRQPFGIGVVGSAVAVGGPSVMRTGEADALGLGCRGETEACPPAPGGEAPGAGEAQDTAAADSSTHTAASRAPGPLIGPIRNHRSIVTGIRHVLRRRPETVCICRVIGWTWW
jgi:hypothetical protein